MGEGPRTVRERVAAAKEKVATWIIKRAVALANQRVDIAAIQSQDDTTQGRICRVTLTDINKSWCFRVLEGRVELLEGPQAIDGEVYFTSETLVALAQGQRKMMHPGTGREFTVEYNPIKALALGEITATGKAASNDALHLARALHREVYPALRDDLALDRSEPR